MEKRNQVSLGELVTVGVSLVVIGLVFAFGTDIVNDVKSDYAAGTPEFEASNYTVYSFSEVTKKLPTIALIIAVAVIITVLTRAFLGAR